MYSRDWCYDTLIKEFHKLKSSGWKCNLDIASHCLQLRSLEMLSVRDAEIVIRRFLVFLNDFSCDNCSVMYSYCPKNMEAYYES